MCYLLKFLVLTFSCNIQVNQNKYVKKRNYFVFTIHQVNKHGVCRRWFTEADVKDFKGGILNSN